MAHDNASTMAALARLFNDPGQLRPGIGLDEDCALACSDPDHEPAHASVGMMLALFPCLAPVSAPSPAF